jgi:thiol-disulfide isomerase/thioredoxin
MSKKSASTSRAKAAPTQAQQRMSAQRAAAARQRIADAQRRRRLIVVGTSVLAVIVVVAVLIVVKVSTDSGPKSGKKATRATSSVITQATAVPAATLDAVGVGAAKTPPSSITAPPLTTGGKPSVLYVGAEYCPYCAAERWPMTIALSRFGKFSNLGQTSSAPDDVYPSTATLTFHGASYSSSLLSFTAREIQSNQVVDGNYAPLDKLDAAQEALVKKYNAPPYVKGSGGAIPFVDIGGKYLISGASYDPQVLQKKTHAQIAAALADPDSSIAKSVDGTANYITAALCTLTGNKPATVCSSTGVTKAAAALDARK